MASRRFGRTSAPARWSSALDGLVGEGDGVLLLGLEDVGDAAWEVLSAAGLRVQRVEDGDAAIRKVEDGEAQVVLADPRQAPRLIQTVRARADLHDLHVVVCVDLASPDDLRAALDAGADDVIRIPFEPEVLAVRVATGLRAARLRANEAMLRSLIDSIPGAIYRCACDGDWTMEWLSDEIERMTGYPASDFIDNAVRTFAEHRAPRRSRVRRDACHAVGGDRPAVLARVPARAPRRLDLLGARARPRPAGRRRPLVAGRRHLRHHRPPRGRARAARARGRPRPSSPRSARRAPASSRPPTARAATSSATSTTARSSASSPSPSACGSGSRSTRTCPRTAARPCSRRSRSSAPGSATCATSPAVCTRPCSPTTGSSTRCARSRQRAAVPGRARARAARRAARRWRSRRPPTSSSSRRSPTSRATRRRPMPGSASRSARAPSRSTVRDDGVGGAVLGGGSGLQGLRDRVSARNGTLEIDSRPGDGTCIRARLPAR